MYDLQHVSRIILYSNDDVSDLESENDLNRSEFDEDATALADDVRNYEISDPGSDDNLDSDSVSDVDSNVGHPSDV